jgi:hypothetical protein
MAAGAEGSPVFDYTSLDFAGIEQDLIRYAQSTFSEEIWTDLNESNEGRRLIELMSYATDLLAYTENAHVRETVISSTIRENNFRAQAKTFDYVMKGRTPATTTLRFTLNAGLLPIFIPSTFRVADRPTSSVIFQPDSDGTATTTTYDIAATQGEQFTAEAVGVSDGSTNQVYELNEPNLLDNTQVITVGGTEYVRISNFIEATPTDEVYKLETDEEDVTTILFGDNINGKVPPLGQSIVATYKVGGGTQGNLPEDVITRLIDSIPGVLSVTNIEAAAGGGPKQSLANAKRALPLHIKANQRCVTVQDYASTAVNLVSGVLKATAVYGAYRGGGSPVLIFVVPNGGGELSPTLANEIITTIRFGVCQHCVVCEPSHHGGCVREEGFCCASSEGPSEECLHGEILT